jgi:hypothetical protein
MAAESLEALLVEALRGIVDYVAVRDDSFTDDDDVKALEDVAQVLSQVAPESCDRLVRMLGPKAAFELGLVDREPGL